MKHTFITATAIAALFVPFAVNAQEVDETDDAVLLDQLIISAGRTPVEQSKTGRAYTVIDGEQIERSQARYVTDVLRQVPGFHVSRTGSFGGLTQLRVRGSEGNHVLVLIDGVEVSETSQGEYDFGGLQASDIERVEVLRGPQSAFYGSDALAGVVNIITKGGKRNSTSAGYQLEYGTDNTRMISGYARGGTDNFDASLSASKRITDGFNISDFGNEDDGDRNLTLNGKFNWDVMPGFSFDGTIRYVDRESDTDAQPFASPVLDTNNGTATEELFGSLGMTLESPDGAWTHRARVMSSDVTREGFLNGARAAGESNNGVRTKAFYQVTHRLADNAGNQHAFTGGYEWEHETFRFLAPVFDPSQLAEQVRETNSLVGEYRGEFADQFYFNAAIRQDYNEQFEDALTYSLAAAWAIPNSGTRLHASVGTGVKNPTFSEQFGFIPASFVGNPNLIPEESFGWDIGVEQTFFDGSFVVDVTYFQQDLENEIATDFGVFPFTAINLQGTSERHGWEVGAKAYLSESLTISGNYTYLDSVEPDGDREVRRPEHSGSVRLDYVEPENGHSLFVEAIFNGVMDDNDFSTFPATPVELDAYTVVNLGATYKVNENFEIYARLENAFDEIYEEVSGYNTQGREAFVGIRGKF